MFKECWKNKSLQCNWSSILNLFVAIAGKGKICQILANIQFDQSNNTFYSQDLDWFSKKEIFVFKIFVHSSIAITKKSTIPTILYKVNFVDILYLRMKLKNSSLTQIVKRRTDGDKPNK